MKKEKELSKYIDMLNKEKTPKDHLGGLSTAEYESLQDTVRKVKSLGESAVPEVGFEERLISAINDTTILSKPNKKSKFLKRALLLTAAAAAAMVILLNFPNNFFSNHDTTSLAYGMEQAYQEINAYHGIIEVMETNELGEQMLQSKREVWADRKGNYYLKEIEGYSKGMITINNTQKKWQIRPEEENVYLFEAFPDPYRFTFELGKEVEDVQKALSTKVVGNEIISGREAILLEVTPKGGDMYKLWMDKETKLPLKRQSAMQNAVRMEVTFVDIAFENTIPLELLTYQVPSGYEVIDTKPEQVVTSLEEAKSIVGFLPLLPSDLSFNYTLQNITVTDNKYVKLNYISSDLRQRIFLLEKKVEGDLDPVSDAMLGVVNNRTAEIRTNYDGVSGVNSIRWQDRTIEYTVYGNEPLMELTQFIERLSESKVLLPVTEADNSQIPKIEVPYDLSVEEVEQKSVDAGHSPWKLDPVFVTQVFASLLISPEGIVGDYPIAYDDITIIKNNGVEAVAKVNSDKTVAEYVYLKRLIRQDDTGIWTVVGYDPAN